MEEYVIRDKGTEKPYTGKCYDFNEKGTDICKRCEAQFYESSFIFESGCGRPGFVAEIHGA